MITRKQKIEELFEGMSSLRRNMAFQDKNSLAIPRITPSQWGIIMLIEQRNNISIKDIAHALRITSSATTQLVDGLVASGYVVRSEDTKDRRIVILTLSKKTKNQVKKMKERMVQKFLEVFEVLNNKEFNQFCILNKKVVERFSNKK